jgi:hypothetical protein
MLVKESELVEIDEEKQLRLEVAVPAVKPPAQMPPYPLGPFAGRSLYEDWSRKRPTA